MGDKRYFFSKEIATPERIAAREEKLGEKDRRERERERVELFLPFEFRFSDSREDPARGPPMDPKTRIYTASEAAIPTDPGIRWEQKNVGLYDGRRVCYSDEV